MRWQAWALAALVATPALAAQDRNDRELIEQGRTLRRAGRNAAALESFRAAYALRPTPEAAGQMGFAEHALEHWEPASRFLRIALGAAADPWVVAQRRALEFSLAQVETHLGSLRVEASAAGATLSLDGRVVGPLPMLDAVRVGAGTVVVETRAPGYEVDRREVTVGAGETVRLVVQLVASQTAVTTGPSPEAGAPLVVRRDAVPPAVVAPPPRNVTRVLGWVSLGFAAAGLGTGLAAMFVRNGAADRWNDDALCLTGGRTREQNCADDRATATTMHDVMVGGYVAGAVLAAGAVVLFVASPSRREAPRVSFGVGPNRADVSFRF